MHNKKNESIAIIGMAGRFPGADNIEQFWKNIINGVNAVSFFDDQTLKNSGVSGSDLNNKHYVKAKGMIEEAEWFDASYFGMPAIEAQITDPQFRVFLECAVEAFENAGYDTCRYSKNISVFTTSSTKNNYYENCILKNSTIKSIANDYQFLISNAKDFLATLVAYKLNCSGAAINVQTACSSSLVAVCLACQNLLNHESDLALAGGVSIKYPLKNGYLYQEGMIYSPDGYCRPFDKNANGMVSGDGLGIVILKRLSDAIEDNDSICAVIKGFAINNDGNDKLGFTAPSIRGQTSVIRDALVKANINPNTLGYIEAHGTGTPLGDAVELSSLKTLLNGGSHKYAIGSVKANIGHLDVASGVAGLIKASLALKNNIIPPSINFKEPNPSLSNSSFYVPTESLTWNKNNFPRRAAISSFGIGGTNAHVILEESEQDTCSKTHRNWHLITLSARTEVALERYKNNLENHVHLNKNIDIANAAYTFQVGRKALPHRLTLLCQKASEIYLQDNHLLETQVALKEKTSIVFMFPGFGSFKLQIGKTLYNTEPVFRQCVDECCIYLNSYIKNFKEKLFLESDVNIENLSITITQPALFVIEYALSKLWLEWGVKPDFLIGHSQGEYVAACLAGVFNLEDALRLVYKRAALVEEFSSGAMLAVLDDAKNISNVLDGENLVLAAINSPTQCVISGEKTAVLNLHAQLKKKEVPAKLISDRYAFHSPQLKNITEKFFNELTSIKFKSPEIPIVSNLRGKLLTAEEAQSPDYWVKHLIGTVNFFGGINYLLKDRTCTFIEIGPGVNLSSMVKQTLLNSSLNSIVISSMPGSHRHEDEDYALLKAAGKLWLTGYNFDWRKFHSHETLFRIPLPTYPYDRQHYAVVPDLKIIPKSVEEKNILTVEDFFYKPIWKKEFLYQTEYLSQNKDCFVILMEKNNIEERIFDLIQKDSKQIIKVYPGTQFEQIDDFSYTVDPESSQHYIKLFKTLFRRHTHIQIIHTWLLNAATKSYLDNVSKVNYFLKKGLFSLLLMAQAIGKLTLNKKVKIGVLTDGLCNITGNERLDPLNATILGAIKVIPLEYETVTCMAIDIDYSEYLPEDHAKFTLLTKKLLYEFTSTARMLTVAYRDSDRFVCDYEQEKFPSKSSSIILKDKGVYLITGGLSGIGLELAEFLAKNYLASLVLVSRTQLPPEDQWQSFVENAKDSSAAKIIQRLQNIKSIGANFFIISADVSDFQSMNDHIKSVEKILGPINGVIHSAGMSSGELIQNKMISHMGENFHAKILGTLVLDEIFKDKNLDFMVLHSALTAITGAIAQTDYVAANAFLDAYAEYGILKRHYPILSLNWDLWKETGMGVRLAQNNAKVLEIKRELSRFPMFSSIYFEDGYHFTIHVPAIWKQFVNGHKLAKKPLLTATLYLELLRSAYTFFSDKNIFIIEKMYIIEPLYIENENALSINLKLKPEEGRYYFSVESRENNSTEWKTNVYGYIFDGQENDFEQTVSLSSLSFNDSINAKVIDPRNTCQTLQLGERWNCLRKLSIIDNQAYGKLSIPDKYVTEIKDFPLYPPLLDATLSCWQRLQSSQYLPFSCDKMVLLSSGLTTDLLVYNKFIPLNQATMHSNSYVFNSEGMLIAQVQNMIFRQFEQGR